MRARRARWAALAAVLFAVLAAPARAAGPSDTDQALRQFLSRLETIVQAADPTAYLDLLTGTASGERAREFMATELRAGATRVVIQERERQAFRNVPPGSAYRLVLDAFLEYGDRARAATWQIDLKKTADDRWQITDEERLSAVENIVRLSMAASQEFDARDFHLGAEDLDLVLEEGKVFTIESPLGTTGFVLMGRGEMRFTPAPATEKQQVKLFAGAESLMTRFTSAYVRTGGFGALLNRAHLSPRPVDPRDLRRAEDIFREESPKSFVLDLSDLTRDTWSLLPGGSDFLAEIRTRKFDTLTYARSESEPEDISLFDRHRQKNISIYPSAAKRAGHGQFYSEDDLVSYDVLDYDIDVALAPDRRWIEGRARMKLRWKTDGPSELALRLADALVVQSVVSDTYGRLFNLRVKNQNSLLVNLPQAPAAGQELTLTIMYGGRLEPQTPDRETLLLQQRDPPSSAPAVLAHDFFAPRVEPSFLYSNRSYWYPQSVVTDFATATMRVTVPAAFDCIASGEAVAGTPIVVGDVQDRRKIFLFRATAPVRYLSLLVSRFVAVDHVSVALDAPMLFAYGRTDVGPKPLPSTTTALALEVITNPDHVHRGRPLMDKAAEVARFYRSVIGDAPYPSFAVALVENQYPGGHSPAYFAMLNQPLTASINWRGDPAAFDGFPDFFLAHEMAHQWWGQAVGWQSYHEQWLSEGFAQYFAALYAQHSRGDDLFWSVMRQMRRWAIAESAQGPVYLGYRLGHVQNSGRTFRALLYNKSAVVLQMLRQLVGDEAFFRGVRRFYAEARFQKTGTSALRRAFEAECGRPLDRFFDRWIFGSSLPRLQWSYRIADSAAAVHVEQEGEVFDVPLTLTLEYADRRAVDVVIPLHETRTDVNIPLDGALRSIAIARHDVSLADISRLP